MGGLFKPLMRISAASFTLASLNDTAEMLFYSLRSACIFHL